MTSARSETAADTSVETLAQTNPAVDASVWLAPPPRTAGPPGHRLFLAPLMGAGEGLGAGLTLREIMADPALKAMGLSLLEEMRQEAPAAPVPDSADDAEHRAHMTGLLEAGTGGEIDTSSSMDEILRFRDRLAFSADLLETLLEQTYTQLESLESYLALHRAQTEASPDTETPDITGGAAS